VAASSARILKGWFDRVLRYGEVYTSRKRFENGRFVGKRAMLSATVGGVLRTGGRFSTCCLSVSLRAAAGGYRADSAKPWRAGMTAQGGTLVVRIDYVTLGPNKDSWAQDNISGVAMLEGRQWPVRAITRCQASSVDQVRVDESNHQRVTQLMQALTY
jgi:hypothetical protein